MFSKGNDMLCQGGMGVLADALSLLRREAVSCGRGQCVQGELGPGVVGASQFFLLGSLGEALAGSL